jgi:hypothetical protein
MSYHGAQRGRCDVFGTRVAEYDELALGFRWGLTK